MAEHDLSKDEVRKMAAEIGVTRLTDEHVEQLLRATNAARARRASMPLDTLVPADEPAHVFQVLPGER
jgi:hypothetical protein